jgi:hypothetical protein
VLLAQDAMLAQDVTQERDATQEQDVMLALDERPERGVM